MNKYIYALLLTIVTVCSAQAQLVFSFGSDTISAPGNTVDIDVIVADGWDEVVGMQFSINWDRTVFSYSSIQNITDEIAQFSEGNIGTPPESPGVDDGELTVSWSGPNTQPVTVPDGTRLFTLRLFGDGELCSGTKLDITSSPLQVEVFDTDFEFIDIQVSGGELAIADETCEMIGMGGDEVALNFTPTRSPEGSMVCLPVTTENFDDIGSVQGGITWDPDVLDYVELKDAGLTSVTANVTNAEAGEMSVLWLFDQDGVTVADGATLFEVCFEVVGSTGSTTTVSFGNSPVTVEVAGVDGIARETTIGSATFTVGTDGTEPEVGVGLIFPELFTNNQPNICVPITTRDFDNIAAIQGGISFNPAVLTYTGVMAGGVPIKDGQIGTNDADEGRLRVLWTVDLGSDAISVADGDVLFEVCFDVIGDEGDRSEVTFINIEFLPIEIVNEDAEALDFFVRDGSVTVGVDANASDITLTASQETGITGDTVCVDFTVDGFTNIEGMGFAIEWDADVIRYIDQRNFNLSGLSNNIFNFASPDRLTLLFAPTAAQSAPDGTSIFQVCYEIVADCGENLSSDISFVAGATPIEFVGNNQQTLTAELVTGRVSAGECAGASVDILSIIRPSCAGDSDGGVTVEFKNLTGAVGCQWVDTDGNVVSTNCNLVGVPGGMYTLTGTDEDDITVTRTVDVRDPGEITTTSDVTDGTCNTATAFTLNVSGGTGPFSYAWTGGLADDNTFSGVSAGTYMVTITDANGCTGEASVTVEDSSFDLTPVVTDATNAAGDNGAIDLQPAASVDATYSWSTGATTAAIEGLTEGTYMVTISDNGSDCQSVQTYEVSSGVLAIGDLLDEINNTYNGFGVSCNGESDGILDGTISGGCDDGPVMVFINDAEVTLPAMNLPAGTHILRLVDACGASVEQEFTITEPEAITAGNVVDRECPMDGGSDGSLRLPAQGGVGTLTYMTAVGTATADGVISGLPDGNFTVIISDDNNCQLMVDNVGFGGICGNTFECEGASFVTPNGDGKNDTFIIPCVNNSDRQPNRLAIYNRWGETLFEMDNYNNSWNGTDQAGADLPEGGYMWVLITGSAGNREITRGTVSLLR